MLKNRWIARVAGGLGLAAGLLVCTGSAAADVVDLQTIPLEVGWNLISFSVLPPDASAEAILGAECGVDYEGDPIYAADVAWSYEASQWRVWTRTQDPAPGAPVLEVLKPGRGYWVKHTNLDCDLQVVGSRLATVEAQLDEGWNLVGFPLLEKTAYPAVFYDESLSPMDPQPIEDVESIWFFDVDWQLFKVVELVDGEEVSADFTQLEPGRGYWVKIRDGSTTSFASLFTTVLPGDEDVPPLLRDPTQGQDLPPQRPPFAMSAGDVNVGELVEPYITDPDYGLDEPYYDRPSDQRALAFSGPQDAQFITIANRGPGVLAWELSIERVDAPDVEWLQVRDDFGVLSDEAAGVVVAEPQTVVLQADGTGLAPGHYFAKLLIRSNGGQAPFPHESERRIPVVLAVPDLEGEYALRAEIDTVNGKPANLPNPRLHLSLYRDGALGSSVEDSQLKAIVDVERTLLFPETMRFMGRLYEDDTTNFTLSASMQIDAGHDANPFDVPLRRDITLIGHRPKPGELIGYAGAETGLLGIIGEYRETIRAGDADPVYLVGSFSAPLVSEEASVLDAGGEKKTLPAGDRAIPDGGSISSTIDVTEDLILAEVDVTVTILHDSPEDLVVVLTSPTGESVTLRDRVDGHVGPAPVRYDLYVETQYPGELDDTFQGHPSRSPDPCAGQTQGRCGEWTLTVSDEVGNSEVGELSSWELHLGGTVVGDLTGTVAESLSGGTVILTGCGAHQLAPVEAGGVFTFRDLVDCAYTLEFVQEDYERQSLMGVVMQDGVVSDPVSFSPVAMQWDAPILVGLPSSVDYALASVTTASGAGSGDQWDRYSMDSATYDLDRPPAGYGDADMTKFKDGMNPATRANWPNCPGYEECPPGEPYQPDYLFCTPEGENSYHAFVAIGGPVVGVSVSGSTYISMGANP